jgi:hypothetical protein
VLKPADSGAPDSIALFSFHFPPDIDNSGFVGWLATRLKRTTGTGVLIVCGQNTQRGGVFDYWGVPTRVRHEVERVLKELR